MTKKKGGKEMSRYNVFYLRGKGTEEGCNQLFKAIYQYDGQLDDPYISYKDVDENACVIEVRGALRGDADKYLISLPEDNSLFALSKTFGMAIEIFASDPGDGEFEHYYFENGNLLESSLPQYVYDFEKWEISEEDQKKYIPLADEGFALKEEFLPDAKWERAEDDEWDEDGEELMMCNFKIKLHNQ